MPNGLNLNSNNGEILGIASASGSFSFCIMATDGGNPSASDKATFQIIINNNPPQLISANFININQRCVKMVGMFGIVHGFCWDDTGEILKGLIGVAQYDSRRKYTVRPVLEQPVDHWFHS